MPVQRVTVPPPMPPPMKRALPLTVSRSCPVPRPVTPVPCTGCELHSEPMQGMTGAARTFRGRGDRPVQTARRPERWKGDEVHVKCFHTCHSNPAARWQELVGFGTKRLQTGTLRVNRDSRKELGSFRGTSSRAGRGSEPAQVAGTRTVDGEAGTEDVSPLSRGWTPGQGSFVPGPLCWACGCRPLPASPCARPSARVLAASSHKSHWIRVHPGDLVLPSCHL